MAAVAVAAGEHLGEGKTSSYKQTNAELGITMATSQDDLPKTGPSQQPTHQSASSCTGGKVYNRVLGGKKNTNCISNI
eukprot:14553029-Ditylum_brightwellii.AAC.1